MQQLREQEEVDRDLADDGADEPPAVAVAKPGDLWVLGEHRLLCGDSTNLKDVLRVMAGEKAALVATDPPYLVDYTGERPNDSGKDWTATYREIDIQDADGRGARSTVPWPEVQPGPHLVGNIGEVLANGYYGPRVGERTEP